MTLIAKDPEKFAVIFPVDTDSWESLTLAAQHVLVKTKLEQSVSRHPEVNGWLEKTFEWRFAELPELNIPGITEEIAENLIFVRATVMAYKKTD